MVAVIISALALALSLYTYFRFDRKIKKQEEIINAHEIAKIQEEELGKKLAQLRIERYWRDKGTLLLRIINEGPSDAYNINIQDLDEESFLFQEIKDKFPIKTVYAGDEEVFELMVYSEMPGKTRLKVDWDDDTKQHHTGKIVLSIH